MKKAIFRYNSISVTTIHHTVFENAVRCTPVISSMLTADI